MILSLESSCDIEDLGPILGTQKLVHREKRVPNRSERHLILIAVEIDGWYIPSNELTGQNSNKEGNHKEKDHQVYDAKYVA